MLHILTKKMGNRDFWGFCKQGLLLRCVGGRGSAIFVCSHDFNWTSKYFVCMFPFDTRVRVAPFKRYPYSCCSSFKTGSKFDIYPPSCSPYKYPCYSKRGHIPSIVRFSINPAGSNLVAREQQSIAPHTRHDNVKEPNLLT